MKRTLIISLGRISHLSAIVYDGYDDCYWGYVFNVFSGYYYDLKRFR